MRNEEMMEKFSSTVSIILLFVLLGLTAGYACEPAVLTTRYFGKITGFPSDEITAVKSDRKGNVYVGTKDKGLVIIPFGKDQWSSIFDETKALSFNAIHTLWFDPDDRLWIGTAGGLNYMDTSSVSLQSKYFAEDGLKDNIVLSIAKDSNGSTLWVGTTSGLVKKEGWFTRLTEADGLCSNIIQALVFDGDNELWIGTQSGMMLKNGLNQFKRIQLTDKDAKISDWVHDLVLKTVTPPEKGVVPDDYQIKLKKTLEAMLAGVKKRAPEQKPIEAFVQAELDKLSQSPPAGTVFAATNNGVFSLDKGTAKGEKWREGWFTALAVNSNGAVFGADTALDVFPIGVSSDIFPGFKISKMITSTLKERIMAEITDDSTENSLAATDKDLLDSLRKMDDEQLEAWVTKKLLTKSISSMCFDPSGTLWIGLEQGGLFRFHPDIVNSDSFLYGIIFNREAGGESRGVNLATKKPEYPPLQQITNGMAHIREAIGRMFHYTPELWVGKWSQLKIEDCVTAAEFVGQWSHPACVMNLTKFLPYDPYVIIPVDFEKR